MGKKIQIYMASSWDEYERALKYAQESESVSDIREIGEMETTNWDGELMFAYVFVFSAPNSYMNELAAHMDVPYVPIG